MGGGRKTCFAEDQDDQEPNMNARQVNEYMLYFNRLYELRKRINIKG
jgi:hypothetical protein